MKQRSVNAGEEIRAMKLLTLHCIASSLYRYIAYCPQLWQEALSSSQSASLKGLSHEIFGPVFWVVRPECEPLVVFKFHVCSFGFKYLF
jgi:hypothetical protein